MSRALARDGATAATAPAAAYAMPALALSAVVGAAAGLGSGLLGIGGGLIAVPLLTAWTDVPVKRAIGTSLVVVLVTSALGVATESVVAPANLMWAAALPLAAGAVTGTWLGARIAQRTPPRTLALLLAALLVVAAAKMAGAIELAVHGTAPAPAALVAVHAVTGVLAGILAATFGIGGGILAVPVLAWLHPEWAFQACRATSLVMIVPTSVAALWLHHRLANVDAALARRLAPAAALGAVAGVILANRVPGRPLELLFASVLLVSAAKIAWKARRGGS